MDALILMVGCGGLGFATAVFVFMFINWLSS